MQLWGLSLRVATTMALPVATGGVDLCKNVGGSKLHSLQARV